MITQECQRTAFVTAGGQDLQTIHGRETDISLIAQCGIQLCFELAEPLMLIDEADFCHLMRRQFFKIAELIAKSAHLMGHQQLRLGSIGKPSLIVENMD